MAGITLAEAIEGVGSYLDDGSNVRWSAAQKTSALIAAVSHCVENYAGRGGERFDEEIEVTVAGTAGVSLLDYDPLTIRAVLVSIESGGAWTSPVRPADNSLRGSPDTSTRDLLVRLVRRPPAPEADTDLLVGLSPGVMRSWPDFDQWVCTVAALALRTKDNDMREALMETNARVQANVMNTVRLPNKLPWPRKRSSSDYLWQLRWLWKPQTVNLSLCLSNIRGF